MPKINFEEEQVFEAFIGKLLMEKGLFEEDKKQHGKMRHELRTELNEEIQKAVIDALPEEQLHQLDASLNSDASDDDIEKFFDEAKINYEDAVSKAMREFREKYLGQSEPAKESAEEVTAPEVMTEETAIVVETPAPVASSAPAPATEPAAEQPTTPVAENPTAIQPVESDFVPNNHDMTINNNTEVASAAAEGVPMQGTTSEVPGASNVEGAADMTMTTEGGM